MTLGNAIKVKSGLGGPAGLWQRGDSPGRRSLTRVCHIERWWHRGAGMGGGGDALCDKGVPKGSAVGVSPVPVWVWGLSQRGGSERGPSVSLGMCSHIGDAHPRSSSRPTQPPRAGAAEPFLVALRLSFPRSTLSSPHRVGRRGWDAARGPRWGLEAQMGSAPSTAVPGE